MLAFEMLWVGVVVHNPTSDAVCEFSDAPFDKTVNVERDSSNRNCLVSTQKLSFKG